MDEIEEMEGYEDVITTVDEPYTNTDADNQSLKNVMYNFLSSNMNIPNDLTSILIAAAFLVISWKALQIVIKLLLAVLWPIIAFTALFFLLPIIGQEEIVRRICVTYNYSKDLLVKMYETIHHIRH